MANQDKTFIAVIIDRSGSMADMVESTVKGFNEFMLEQRGAAGEARMTVVLFDDRYEVLVDDVDVKLIPDLDANVTNLARGTTAMRDAIGRTIINIKEKIAAMDEDDRPAKVLFVITTDGQDNASTDFDKEKLEKAIKFQRDIDKWEFLFTGADESLILAAQELGISKGNVSVYANTSAGVLKNYHKMSAATVTYRSVSLDNSNVAANLFVDDIDKENT
jgi:uncharacterized protein YegL